MSLSNERIVKTSDIEIPVSDESGGNAKPSGIAINRLITPRDFEGSEQSLNSV